jgi:hypothetical protein
VPRGQRDRSLRPYSGVSRPNLLCKSNHHNTAHLVIMDVIDGAPWKGRNISTPMTCFGGAVNRNSFHFLILFLTSLHVSASTGHPQVKSTQSFLEAVTPTTDILGYTVYYFILCYVML